MDNALAFGRPVRAPRRSHGNITHKLENFLGRVFENGDKKTIYDDCS
jgi:hypothetical protein